MLDFQPITLGIKELVDSYTFKYGEGSCQHSFVSSWCLRHKYADTFCEHDGFLYTLRSGKSTDSERVYLFPLGSRDIHAVKDAVINVLADAHENNSRVKFETVTSWVNDVVMGLFPENFTSEYRRDLSEYVYETSKLATYAGPDMAYKRRDFMRFGRDYAGRAEARVITPEDIPAIREFQAQWLNSKLEGINDHILRKHMLGEDKAVQNALDDFAALGLTGVVVLIDGQVKGYAYGARLSEDYINEINENCDRSIPNIYPFAKHEFARLCCEGIKYINFEEDIGSASLRSAKNHYKPAFMTDKYILTEK